MGKIRLIINQLICFPIKCYQYCISPLLTPCCRFYPSCSQYAIEAIHYHGLCKGLYKTTARLLRCHPWAQGGYDPVYPRKENH